MSKSLAVLIVEDTESDAQLLIRVLGKAGFEVVSQQVETAAEMKDALLEKIWDIVISDYCLPQFGAPAALQVLQETGQDLPFIIVSGTVGEEIAVEMMKAGAHDYLTKDNLRRLPHAIEREIAQAEVRRQRKKVEAELKSIEWMLTKRGATDGGEPIERLDRREPGSADAESKGLIMRCVGRELLESIARDHLDLLGTSCAIYEADGGYSCGYLSSGWCRMVELAVRRLGSNGCQGDRGKTQDARCHDGGKGMCVGKAMEQRVPVDMECNCGIRRYAAPIIAHEEVVGAISFAYGDPPKAPDRLRALANELNLDLDDLVREAHAYHSRPNYIIEMAKGRLLHSARLIASVVEAKQADSMLRNTLESLRRAVQTTIQVLVRAVEAKDPYTAGHQRRVADLAVAIAAKMSLSGEMLEGIRLAGSIHDIGKVSIPSEILSKPTVLTQLEFALVKEHAQHGYDILKDVESPWPLAQIVWQHHERMNGSGYPRGIEGEAICLESRIVAVADVVEAMSSHRPYRPALGMTVALEEIEKNSGILYDSRVVEVCRSLVVDEGYRLELVWK